jgi:nucleoside-diphosphate-sugar epimerase
MPVPSASDRGLTVAVTGPTGTFGFGLIPRLQDDDRISHIIGIARRPFDPIAHGWTKMEYRRGDVRDPAPLEKAFHGVDVVVHLAFVIIGNAPRQTIREINIAGTLNTFRAAAKANVRRFVYASSVAAYGFYRDNPVGIAEDWPTRPAKRLFYAQEKAELERLLTEASAAHPGLGLYLLRPSVVLGPHAFGAKAALPGPLATVGSRLAGVRTLRLPLPAFVPNVRMQFVHEDDVGQAFLLCIVGAGPPGAYNIAGDGVLTGADIAREFGLLAIPIPAGLVQAAARAAMHVPMPPWAEWLEAVTQPVIMDTTKAKRQLGWHPRHTGADALRSTLRPLTG